MLKYLSARIARATLKKKIFLLIGGVAIIPMVLIALLALSYYYLGIEKLFHEKISSTVTSTVKVAELYLNEHKENIRADVLSIASGVYKNHFVLNENPELYNEFLDKQAELRDIADAIIFTPDKILGKTALSFALAFSTFPAEQLAKAENGEVVILEDNLEDRVRAFIKLDHYMDTYLMVSRYIDKDIINHIKSTQGSASHYQALLQEIDTTRIKLEIAFVIISILLCVGAIALANKMANIIARPINQLVEATEHIKLGNYDIRVPQSDIAKDETAILARAFNSMTQKIDQQTSELISARDIIDERRRFIETVLKELSSGVLVLDAEGKISLCNQAALKLLNISEEEAINVPFSKLLNEIEHLLTKAVQSPNALLQEEIIIERDDRKIYLFFSIVSEIDIQNNLVRYIITFDDMSKLVAAQRSAAWADVARRIAHEIKNPLTPITLAAEQLKRKYLKQIEQDAETFARYINTIIRHVDDIGAIVEEFVLFAKIPSPKLAKINLYSIVQEVVFSQKNVHPKIEYFIDIEKDRWYASCDRAQITQVFINLLKNAAEAINMKAATVDFKGRIQVICHQHITQGLVTVEVVDNGCGISSEVLDRIAEPYVTTKATGTGLGLSIVKKIIGDHGGTLSFNNTEEGTVVSFTLQLHNSIIGDSSYAQNAT